MLSSRRLALIAAVGAVAAAGADADTGHAADHGSAASVALRADPLAQAQTLINTAQSQAVRTDGKLLADERSLRKASPRFAALADREHLNVEVRADNGVTVKLGLHVTVRDVAVVQMRFVRA